MHHLRVRQLQRQLRAQQPHRQGGPHDRPEAGGWREGSTVSCSGSRRRMEQMQWAGGCAIALAVAAVTAAVAGAR